MATPTHTVDPNRADMLTPEVAAAIDEQYAYHPWDHKQQQAGERIRTALAMAAKCIVDCAPPSPDRSAALRKLREARMDANSAITHKGRW